MGRWAEVYFTSPPEKREAAVQELLRELMGADAGQVQIATSEQVAERNPSPREENRESSSSPDLTEHAQRCPSCQQQNPIEQRFCGMCGTRLTGEASAADSSELTETQNAPAGVWERPAPSTDSRAVDETPDHAPIQNENTTPMWPVRGEGFLHVEIGSEASPYRYRIYFGVALAMLAVSLTYIAWRGSDARSAHRVDHAIAAAQPPSPPPSNAVTPAASNTEAGRKDTRPAGAAVTPASPEVKTVSKEEKRDSTPPSQQAAAAAQQAPQTSTVPPSDITPPVELSGDGDLAMAQQFLDGKNGRDPAEAAKWLWKAVGKQNSTAAVLLSDLYLRGDGVTKSCDQARLLLDAAARRGGAAAAERLRSLQAFGCQ